MARHYHKISDITSTRNVYNIKVRVIRLWKVGKKNDPKRIFLTELILMDEQGDKIHASLRSDSSLSYPILKEGGSYVISNFDLALYDIAYKFSSHKYKIIFSKSTSVECESLKVPLHGFNFVNFEDISSDTLPGDKLIDVIGVMVGISDQIHTFPKGGGIGKRINIQLKDDRDYVIHCTLWSEYAEQFRPYIGVSPDDLFVVIIQFGRVNVWQGRPDLSNEYAGTRIFLNDDNIPEVISFKERFTKKYGPAASLNVLQITSETSYSEADIFLRCKERKTIEEINDLLQAKEKIQCVTLATIDHIDDTNGWYYISCRKCKSKVIPMEDKFWCKKCKDLITYTTLRFSVQVTVIDGSGSASFTLFDKEVSNVVKKTVSNILQSKNEEDDVNAIPAEIKALLNKRFLFIAMITQYNIDRLPSLSSFTVTNLSEDPSLIEKFQELNSPSMEVNDSSNIGSEIGSKGSSNEIITPLKRTIDVVDVEDDEVSLAEGDNSIANKKIMKVKIEKLD